MTLESEMPSEILAMFYDWPTWLIVVSLFALMMAANEFGFLYGRREHNRESELSRSVSNALKGSVFGLVALLLAFSFSATTNRYDLRQRLVLDQANAVGTCYLRAGLLAEADRDRIQGILRQYVDVRLEHYRVGHDDAALARTLSEINQLLTQL